MSAAATLRRKIMRLLPNKRTEQEAIRKIVIDLDYDIAGALGSINNLYNVHRSRIWAPSCLTNGV